MITALNLGANTVELKKSVLFMDNNPDRRALRKKIMALGGVDMIGAGNLAEAASIWHRDRYDMVLIDIRLDYRGALAFRDEIKKDSPGQIVAFLVGKPNYVSLQPAPGSYAPEEHGMEWGESMRKAVKQSCESLPQRNGFVEAGFRIATAKRANGLKEQAEPAEESLRSSDIEPVERAG
jgi:CheY-like chemotaxis protein